MTNCPSDLSFSSVHAAKRRIKAEEKMGSNTVNRIIAFSLFLLGAKREDIAQYLKMPFGTLLSFLTRMGAFGFMAFEDLRTTAAKFQPKQERSSRCRLESQQESICIPLGSSERVLKISRTNPMQLKVVLLTFVENGLLSIKEVSDAVGLSVRRLQDLKAAMKKDDVLAVVDKRKGQQTDYRFTTEVKSELIQQFSANVISGKPTSSRVLAKDIKERCNLELSDRSIRLYFDKLGLSRITNTLPALVEELKKNS